jgi:phosphoribosyl 1,2-cyclic phosphodiesterase
MLRFTILGSGSAGNCAFLETEYSRVLIDAGFSVRQIEARLQSVGHTVADIDAVFVTHEHSDHVCGLPPLAKRSGLAIFANRLTAETLRPKMEDCQSWKIFETGQTILYRDLKVETFSVPHDAYDPVGFLFRHRLGNIGFLTDLGYASHLVIERIRPSRALVLEANHDLGLIQRDKKRPWPVKQRILSRHGHLSNEAAAAVAAKLGDNGLEDLYLGHLSADCNHPELARAAVASALTIPTIRLHDTSQNHPGTTLEWTG